jgi:CheY-like chemotaxis protein
MNAESPQILVVEDNRNLLDILCEMLAALGHRAHGVASAEEALAQLSRQHFRVLLADIQLPGMSGIELARAALRIAPSMRIIFSSGYGYLVADKLDFDFVLLHKPYFMHQLADAVGRALDAARRNQNVIPR